MDVIFLAPIGIFPSFQLVPDKDSYTDVVSVPTWLW